MKNFFLEHTPFFVLMQEHIRLNSTRVIEGLIIAIITAVVTSVVMSYQTIGKIQVTLEELKASDARIERKVDEMYRDIYKPYIDDGDK